VGQNLKKDLNPDQAAERRDDPDRRRMAVAAFLNTIVFISNALMLGIIEGSSRCSQP
jgi:hypothetical protein